MRVIFSIFLLASHNLCCYTDKEYFGLNPGISTLNTNKILFNRVH